MKSTFQVSSFDLSFSCNFVWQLSCFCLCFCFSLFYDMGTFTTNFVTVTLRFVLIGLHFFLLDSWWVFGPVYVFFSITDLHLNFCLFMTHIFCQLFKCHASQKGGILLPHFYFWLSCCHLMENYFSSGFFGLSQPLTRLFPFPLFEFLDYLYRMLQGNIIWKIHYWFCLSSSIFWTLTLFVVIWREKKSGIFLR